MPITRLAVQMQLILVTLLLTMATANAQQAPPVGFNISPVGLIVGIAVTFFVLGCFSICIRNCTVPDVADAAQAGAMTTSRWQTRGLDKEVIESLPVMSYAKAKELKIGKGALECAVCLSEFEDDDELKLLPKCSHVFHPDCIDAWLAGHSTCPVCRSNVQPDTVLPIATLTTHNSGNASSEAAPRNDDFGPSTAATAPMPVVVIDVSESTEEEEHRRKEEEMELQRIGSQRRALRSKTVNIQRSHSTGHSLAMRLGGNNLDRYTLRLPEHVHKELIAAGEESLRRARRVGEGSSRAGRSARLGRSDRWPSFLTRTLSTRVPFWPRRDGDESVRRRESDAESVKREEEKEASTNRGKRAAAAAAKSPRFELLGNGGAMATGKVGDASDEEAAVHVMAIA